MTARRFGGANASAIGRLFALSISVAAIAGFADAGAAAAAGERGAQLAASCASCHRLDGRDVGIPSIVGLDAATLTGAMQAFKSGARVSQIATVAGYLATLRVENQRP